MAAASRRLQDIQSQAANKICVDYTQKNPQWASVSYGVFMCLECSDKHCGLGVHISFVRSITMDSWSEVQIKKMEVGGNDKLLPAICKRQFVSYNLQYATFNMQPSICNLRHANFNLQSTTYNL
ncbi:hypothetical protein LR48_Vigan01g286600 [Vigna angularis]|nr:hypothetical protein LR48_Vigan01g286600 [Vigna angularis]